MTGLHRSVQARRRSVKPGISEDGDHHLIGGGDHRYACLGGRRGQRRDDWLGQRTTNVHRQRWYQACRRHQINRDALPLGRVRADLKLVPELIRNLVRLNEVASQAGYRHSHLLPREPVGQVKLTDRQALKQMRDCPGDRLVPAPPGRLYGLGSNVHGPRSGQLIRRFGPAPGHCGDHPGATEHGDLQRADSAAERDEPAHVYPARLAKRGEYDAANQPTIVNGQSKWPSTPSGDTSDPSTEPASRIGQMTSGKAGPRPPPRRTTTAATTPSTANKSQVTAPEALRPYRSQMSTTTGATPARYHPNVTTIATHKPARS